MNFGSKQKITYDLTAQTFKDKYNELMPKFKIKAYNIQTKYQEWYAAKKSGRGPAMTSNKLIQYQ